MRRVAFRRLPLTIALGVCGIVMAFSAAAGTRGDAAVSPPDAATEPCEHLAIDRQAACLEERDRRDAERDAGRQAAWDAVIQGYLKPLAERLAASDLPRRRAIAAILFAMAAGEHPDPRVRALREALVRDAGDDPVVDVLLQEYRVMTKAEHETESARALEALRRWRTSEPGNLVPVLSMGEPIDTVLAQADAFDRFSLHFSEVLHTIDDAMAEAPPDDAMRAAMRRAENDPGDMAFSFALQWSVMAAPSFTPLLSACKENARHATPTRSAECRHIGRMMLAHSDTKLGELIGAALLRHDDDPAVRAESDAWRRASAWQQRFADTLDEAFLRTCVPATMRATPGLGEGDAIRACLRDAGIALAPPADWSPDAAPVSGP